VQLDRNHGLDGHIAVPPQVKPVHKLRTLGLGPPQRDLGHNLVHSLYADVSLNLSLSTRQRSAHHDATSWDAQCLLIRHLIFNLWVAAVIGLGHSIRLCRRNRLVTRDTVRFLTIRGSIFNENSNHEALNLLFPARSAPPVIDIFVWLFKARLTAPLITSTAFEDERTG